LCIESNPRIKSLAPLPIAAVFVVEGRVARAKTLESELLLRVPRP